MVYGRYTVPQTTVFVSDGNPAPRSGFGVIFTLRFGNGFPAEVRSRSHPGAKSEVCNNGKKHCGSYTGMVSMAGLNFGSNRLGPEIVLPSVLPQNGWSPGHDKVAVVLP